MTQYCVKAHDVSILHGRFVVGSLVESLAVEVCTKYEEHILTADHPN